jgi:hypothetical protein
VEQDERDARRIAVHLVVHAQAVHGGAPALHGNSGFVTTSTGRLSVNGFWHRAFRALRCARTERHRQRHAERAKIKHL